MSRIGNFFVLMRERLWIVPILISCLALALAYSLIHLGASLLSPIVSEGEPRWLFSGDASTARGLLSSLLSGLLTMTSLVVSVTFVILTLAANQLGPRLISTFLGDRQIQVVLGLFLGTILYVLVVLGSLDEAQGSRGVPRLAINCRRGAHNPVPLRAPVLPRQGCPLDHCRQRGRAGLAPSPPKHP